ncbi:MAG: hypothetical protein PHS92_04300 [Candidatus Gracilibacteria bacterium]|nr:hypothetical protein [Candidatus Gracilibacteria bacterium]
MVKLDLKALQNKPVQTDEASFASEEISAKTVSIQNDLPVNMPIPQIKEETRNNDEQSVSNNKKMSLSSLIGGSDMLPKSAIKSSVIIERPEVKEEKPAVSGKISIGLNLDVPVINSIKTETISSNQAEESVPVIEQEEIKTTIEESLSESQETIPEIIQEEIKETIVITETTSSESVVISETKNSESLVIGDVEEKAQTDNIEPVQEKEFFPNFDIAKELYISEDEFIKNNNGNTESKTAELLTLDPISETKQPIATAEDIADTVEKKADYVSHVKGILSGNRQTKGLLSFKKKVIIIVALIAGVGLFGTLGTISILNQKASVIESGTSTMSTGGSRTYKEGVDYSILKNSKKNTRKNKTSSGGTSVLNIIGK